MEWKTATLLLILASVLTTSFYIRKVPRDLIYFIGGALTLLVGITPAKEFMLNLTYAPTLALLFLFMLLTILKEPLFDRSIPLKTPKDFINLLPEGLWTAALAGFFFMAAFKQTTLPTQAGSVLFWLMGENPFFIVAFLMVAIYLLAHVLPPAFVLVAILPFVQATLRLSMPLGDVTIATSSVVLFAVFFASLYIKSRQRVKVKVRAPLLILFFSFAAF